MPLLTALMRTYITFSYDNHIFSGRTEERYSNCHAYGYLIPVISLYFWSQIFRAAFNILLGPLMAGIDVTFYTSVTQKLQTFTKTNIYQYDMSCDVILIHHDVIKWKPFMRYWPFVQEIHRSPMISPHKGQWRGALVFSLICAWINGLVNNCEACDLGHRRAHFDVTVMYWTLTAI